MKLPTYLFRGDNDIKGTRNLKASIHFGQLQTTLLNGGQGHIIFKTPLCELISKHVCSGWTTSHFLSFSEEERTAFRFALDCNEENLDELINNSKEYYDNEKDWDFTIIKLNLGLVKWKQVSNGIYEGNYPTQLINFKKYSDNYRVILIDVAEAISKLENPAAYKVILDNACRDKEWLLLPATLVDLNFNKREFSGIIDINYLYELVHYKINNNIWNNYKIHKIQE
jgi:hypothetical protein